VFCSKRKVAGVLARATEPGLFFPGAGWQGLTNRGNEKRWQEEGFNVDLERKNVELTTKTSAGREAQQIFRCFYSKFEGRLRVPDRVQWPTGPFEIMVEIGLWFRLGEGGGFL
jgi:hypothetical protein